MGITIRDRRTHAKGKSTGNRQKFLKRVKGSIQAAGHNIINGNVGNTASSGSVHVNKDILSEPVFVYMNGGYQTIVLPGNREFVRGDEIELESSGGSGGGGSGDGEDGFSVEISRDEFLDVFFEDLELPNLEKNEETSLLDFSFKNGGYVTDGSPAKLSIIQSKKRAKLRKLALTSSSRKKLKEVEAELQDLIELLQSLTSDAEVILIEARILELQSKAAALNSKIKKIPALEEIDLRYRSSVKVPVLTSSAVIFFIMDNSGSMGLEEKTLARKFFTLLFLFVKRKYGNADLVFISHTDTAKEMTEEEFFTTRDSGGTMVSTALTLVTDIINKRYSSKKTNIFISQASDGDNWGQDSSLCFKELANNILPRIQHFSYIQVGEMGYTNDTQLWTTYTLIAKHVDRFAAEKIQDSDEIYPAFQRIFKKKTEGDNQ